MSQSFGISIICTGLRTALGSLQRAQHVHQRLNSEVWPPACHRCKVWGALPTSYSQT